MKFNSNLIACIIALVVLIVALVPIVKKNGGWANVVLLVGAAAVFSLTVWQEIVKYREQANEAGVRLQQYEELLDSTRSVLQRVDSNLGVSNNTLQYTSLAIENIDRVQNVTDSVNMHAKGILNDLGTVQVSAKHIERFTDAMVYPIEPIRVDIHYQQYFRKDDFEASFPELSNRLNKGAFTLGNYELSKFNEAAKMKLLNYEMGLYFFKKENIRKLYPSTFLTNGRFFSEWIQLDIKKEKLENLFASFYAEGNSVKVEVNRWYNNVMVINNDTADVRSLKELVGTLFAGFIAKNNLDSVSNFTISIYTIDRGDPIIRFVKEIHTSKEFDGSFYFESRVVRHDLKKQYDGP